MTSVVYRLVRNLQMFFLKSKTLKRGNLKMAQEMTKVSSLVLKIISILARMNV